MNPPHNENSSMWPWTIAIVTCVVFAALQWLRKGSLSFADAGRIVAAAGGVLVAAFLIRRRVKGKGISDS
jgi:drug/metabolite transporter superfamily protein YnfA